MNSQSKRVHDVLYPLLRVLAPLHKIFSKIFQVSPARSRGKRRPARTG